MRNQNETIIIDDDRNEAFGEQSSIYSSTRSRFQDKVGFPKCPLCLENLNELKQRNKKLVAMPCGHVLYNKCLDEYFKSGGPQNKAVLCPTCRTKITKSKVIKNIIGMG